MRNARGNRSADEKISGKQKRERGLQERGRCKRHYGGKVQKRGKLTSKTQERGVQKREGQKRRGQERGMQESEEQESSARKRNERNRSV